MSTERRSGNTHETDDLQYRRILSERLPGAELSDASLSTASDCVHRHHA